MSKTKGTKAKCVTGSGIYELKDGTLLSDTGTNQFQVVEKAEVNLFDKNDVNELLEKYSFEPEIEKDILKYSQRAVKQNNKKSKAVIYVPIVPLTKSTTISYYSYGGYDLKDTKIDLYNQETDVITLIQGTASKSFVDGVTQGIFSIGGIFSKAISIFGSGMSLLDSIEDVIGVVTGTSSSNYAKTHLQYDAHTKYTSVDWGYGYETSMITQSLYARKEQFEFNMTTSSGNVVDTTERSIYEWEESDDYDNPAPEAIINTGFVKDYRIGYEIGDYTFEF
ncbi:MAG TPA: hypothetical protein DDX29_08120 [Clostridiales bacterium]|nr:hypothetical protein [Clostridiales bacterium]